MLMHRIHSPKRNGWWFAIIAAIACATSSSVQAQSGDALIDKLVEKGILTTDEANGLRDEVDKGFTQAYQVKTGMPDWVTSLKLSGDLRSRYEGFFSDNSQFAERNRFRYRLRAGFTAVLKDDFEVAFRLTSSEPSGSFGGDPVSGNTTLSGNGSKKFIYLDLAYVKWAPLHEKDWNVSTTFGKMENPFTFPSSLVFDKDYTPEGLAADVSYRFDEHQTLRWTGGAFALNELRDTTKDAYMYGTQLRLNSVWSKQISSSLGAGFFGLQNPSFLVGKPPKPTDALATDQVPDQQRGNSRDAAGNLLYEYNPIYIDAALTYAFESAPFYTGPFPITVAGDFLHNPAVSEKNEGYSMGIHFGKAGKKKTYEVAYRFIELQADAWYEETTESDFGAFYEGAPVGGRAGYGAGTNVRGHVVKLSYSPYDQLTLALTLFLTHLIDESPARPISVDSNSDMKRLQVDAVWRF